MRSALAAELLPRCDFPPRGAAIACAVSGGADSLALLALAVAAGLDATAYHVDHGLRAGSALEAEVVARAAARLGAGFVALRVECPPGPNLEARARALRLAALPDGVATGHTADDQAETVLLNLLRGSGLDGLAGMRRGWRHPILGLRRHETARLVASLGLETVHDPSNEDGAFRRNRVRRELLPLADEIAGRDVAGLLAREAELLAEDAALLDRLAEAVDPTSTAALRAAPLPLARRALRRWLRGRLPGGHPPSAAAVERVLAVARGEVRACELPGGWRVVRRAGRLVAEHRAAAEH
ncbi:MAG TPA: tRNA lysidine(34) synthetase TilS [Acidimicrobiales bacterium]|nr:tRNA lysidine(34) synthetase TilS [Acidimicrobiales bacterium]